MTHIPILLVAGLLRVAPVPVGDDVDLALHQPVVVSSVETCCGNDRPGYAVDGRAETHWASERSDPQWIYVDLGQRFEINKVVLHWDKAFGQVYTLDVSGDAEIWTEIFREEKGDGAVDTLSGLQGVGRYVRMQGWRRGTPFGYAVRAFEVYGTPAGVPDADFSVSTLEAAVGELITFDGATARDPDGMIVYYQWDLGDGTQIPGAIIQHAYTTPGTYTVTYMVTDDEGKPGIRQKNVVIKDGN